MIKKVFAFFNNIAYLLFKSANQVFSLFSLFVRLSPHDRKGAASILFFSVESLVSIVRYKRSGRKVLSLIDEKERVKERGKKLFILGSGPSVNSYTPADWEHIRKNDSWGFNLWFCHNFVPSVYIAQALIEPQTDKAGSFSFNTNVTLSEMLRDRKESYAATDFFIRGDAVNKQEFYNTEFGKNLEQIIERSGAFYAEMPVSSTNRIPPDILLEKLFERRFFNIDKEIQVVPKFGSTITELISLALMFGYTEIILCGIDMNDGGHFYDNVESFQRYPYLRTLSRINHTRTAEGGHEHMDSSSRPFTVKDYIIALRDFAKSRFDSDIYVMREETSLYPEISKYNYDAQDS